MHIFMGKPVGDTSLMSLTLYRAIEKDLKESLATLHLQETTSRQMKEIQRRENLESVEGAQKQNRRLHVELPFHSKFLLIAPYLASYNPAKSDKRFFVKHHGKQRKTKAGIAAKERAVSCQLSGPKASRQDFGKPFLLQDRKFFTKSSIK